MTTLCSLGSAPRIARDLAWAIGSPPLLTPQGDERFLSSEWFENELTLFQAPLLALAEDAKACDELTRSISSLRLGGYFEGLILWWLDHSDRYDVLAHNLQVHEDGRTLGAFDLIVRNLTDDAIEHWELACKFYLQDGQPNDIHSWFGPARKDKLVLKYKHLLNHQISLSTGAAGKRLLAERGWPVHRHRIIVKGRLFGDCATLPKEVNPQCLTGWLTTATDYQASSAHIPLQRQHWMSELQQGDITQPNASTAHRHGCLCVANLDGKTENSRGFVVPPGWLQES